MSFFRVDTSSKPSIPLPTVVRPTTTGIKVTYDSTGKIVTSNSLVATDIPDLAISQITDLQSTLDALVIDPLPSGTLNDILYYNGISWTAGDQTAIFNALSLGSAALYNFADFAPSSHSHVLSGDVTGTIGATVIPSSSITYDQLQDTSVPSILLGRGDSGAGPVEEISLGSNLDMTGTILTVTNAALTKLDDTNVTLTLGGTPTTALLSAASLTLGWTGQLAVTRGGTGLATLSQGDILYASAANTLSALAKDINTTRYISNGGTSNNPMWDQVNLTNGVIGTLPVTRGGTGLSSTVQGNLLYGSAANTYSSLTKDTNATRYLSNTGTSNNPAWAQVNLTNGVTGTLPVASGGTGATTFTNNYILTGNGTSAIVGEANATFDGTTLALASNSNSQTNNITIRNSSSGAAAAGMIRFWNDASSASNRGYVDQLTSSTYSSPYTSSMVHWLYESGNQIWATNNSPQMLLNSTGLFLGGTTSPSARLHVNGNAYITGNLGIGTTPTSRLDVNGNALVTGTSTVTGNLVVNSTGQYPGAFARTSGSPGRIAIDNASNSGFSFLNSGAEKWVIASYLPSGTNYSFSFYNQQLGSDAFFLNGDNNFVGFGVNSSLAARVHIKGTGTTSATYSLLLENSSGTDYLTVNNAGQLYLGSSTPNASSLFQMDSTTLGFARPRMTLAQRDAIPSPLEGLSIYNSTTKGNDYYNGTRWIRTTQTTGTPTVTAATGYSAASATGNDLSGYITFTSAGSAVTGKVVDFDFSSAFPASSTYSVIFSNKDMDAASTNLAACLYITNQTVSGFDIEWNNTLISTLTAGSITYVPVGTYEIYYIIKQTT